MTQLNKSVQTEREDKIIYPESDGKPMGDNTKQTRWIINLVNGLEAEFRQNPHVFVGGNLLWYPYKGDNHTFIVPDAMVVFGRPKGDRGSYQQWKEAGIAPQVVFEVKSPNNTIAELKDKAATYARYGSEEYYMYDPDRGRLRGWLLQSGRPVELANMRGWISPRLGVRFDLNGKDLVMLGSNNQPFLNYFQVVQNYEQAAQEAENERKARQELERQNARLKELLRKADINPDDLL